MRTAVAIVCLAMVSAVTPARAQQTETAVVPATITVGDVFHATVRMQLTHGTQLVAPDSLVAGEDIESAGARIVREDTVAGTRRVTVAYPLAAWRPRQYRLPDVTMRVAGAGMDSTVRVTFPSFEVASVLPSDTAGIEPKPAKDVLGANRLWWPILLALLLAAVVVTAIAIWWRRRRRADEPVVFTPAVPPREVALAELDRLRREGLIERGELRLLYERLTETLRHYGAALDPAWSADLTTAELAARLRRDARLTDALELTRILGAADMVKFARASVTRDSARGDLDAARAWVERFQHPDTPLPDARDDGADDARAA